MLGKFSVTAALRLLAGCAIPILLFAPARAGIFAVPDQDPGWKPYRPWFGEPEPLSERAQALVGEKDYGAAAAVYGRMARNAQEAGNRVLSLCNRAWCLQKAGQLDEAFEVYKQVLDRYPVFAPYETVVQQLRKLGRQFARGKGTTFGMSNRSKAIEVFTYVRQSAPADERAPADLLELGRLYEQSGEEDADAIRSYRELIREFPGSAAANAARLRLSKLLLERTDYATGPGGFSREIEEYLNTYLESAGPGAGSETARRLMRRLKESQARRLLQRGEFYANPHMHFRPRAARRYLHDVRRQYPRTRAAERADQLLAQLEETTSGQEEADAEDTPQPPESAAADAPSERAAQLDPDRLPAPAATAEGKSAGEVGKWLLPLDELPVGQSD